MTACSTIHYRRGALVHTAHRVGFAWSSEMLERGIYVHPWHNMFLSAAMTAADIDAALDAVEGAFAAVKARRATLRPAEKLQAFRR